MTVSLEEIIRRHLQSLAPVPTAESPRLSPLPDVRAVLFDVYGTMIISASGDVGTVAAGRALAVSEAFAACDIPLPGDPEAVIECLQAVIAGDHERKRAEGIEYPEVDIRQIWQQVVSTLAQRGVLPSTTQVSDYARLALEYEMRVNPVWPMPGITSLLEGLRAAESKLGIVSNAQFFTPLVLSVLLEGSPCDLGFPENLQFYSYRYDWAKPGRFLYEQAERQLATLGIAPQQMLYIGNDMLNDVLPAAQVGFRTALFAGDARSLRLRKGDSRVSGVQPDLVITELDQLIPCLFP